MSVAARLLALLPFILVLLLLAVAGTAYARINSLYLPISKALALLTFVLPLITAGSTHATSILLRKAKRGEQAQLTLPLLAIIGFQLIYETIVGTLAVTHIIPPSDLVCGLERKWDQLFRAKDHRAIKRLQDTFECCGFNKVHDRAWPFPTDKPSTCPVVFSRTESCKGGWRQAEQTTAGLLLLVVVVVFLVKVLSIIGLLTSSSWARPQWAITDVSHEDSPQDSRAEIRRRIEEGNIASEFRDEPEVEGEPGLIEAPTNGQQSRVQPSHLVLENEWQH